jgi:dTMP kinase
MSGARRGFLFVLEGPEGVGKTTQVTAVRRRLHESGVDPVLSYREPGDTPLGVEIRTLLLSPDHVAINPRAEALLFMAARAQLVSRVKAQLREGAVVLLDRFFLSTYAYQIGGRGLPRDLVRSANALAVDGLQPDLTILLACDLETAHARMVARGDLDRMEQEDQDFHARVTDAFLAAADPEWQRAHPEVGPVVRVDANGQPSEVTDRILAALGARWPETFRALRESQ